MNTEINRKEEIKKQVNNLLGVFEEVAKLNIAVCSEWKVTGVKIAKSCAEISICLNVCNDFYMKISYDKGCNPIIKESFETKVMGHDAFQLLQDSYIADYYCAAANLIQHKKMLGLLKEHMVSSVKIYNTLYTEYESLGSQEG